MNVLSPLKKRLGKGGFIRSVATLTVGDTLAQKVISLPMNPGLDAADQRRIVAPPEEACA